ncbi:hypothetical protein [Sporolactobacillus nakayamae]|uniref:Uncharacterized protein n=1 Tax=Sporolactobacillus nakayamae TaxID=269670 RepID=A0A1I2W212_9BACL|nr:hypothetical protein [Sporolactobacillus nakayamae]SFG94096.1 hypothetical protein SAMN02982927_03316 [Sporolactobacillus nakayamae]
MTVSLGNNLLNYLSQINQSNSGTTTSSTDKKELSSEFAQLLASSLMNDSSSQMFSTLSLSGSDSASTDSDDANSIANISNQGTNSVEDLLWSLLSSSANANTSTVSGSSI